VRSCLDAFVDHLVAADWFQSMYENVTATGVNFTAVEVVTPDPASVEIILAWSNQLQDRVDYVVVENATSTLSDFTYWRSTDQAMKFRDAFRANSPTNGVPACGAWEAGPGREMIKTGT
jgi:hypothetical protein